MVNTKKKLSIIKPTHTLKRKIKHHTHLYLLPFLKDFFYFYFLVYVLQKRAQKTSFRYDCVWLSLTFLFSGSLSPLLLIKNMHERA